jgi:hypothetical protein
MPSVFSANGSNEGLSKVRNEIHCDGVNFLQTFPFIGLITSYHLGTKISLEVVKPDLIGKSSGLHWQTRSCCRLTFGSSKKVDAVHRLCPTAVKRVQENSAHEIPRLMPKGAPVLSAQQDQKHRA